MNRSSRLAVVVAAALLASARRAPAATLIDFEDLPPGTIVDTQYSARGLPILFQGSEIFRPDIPPTSGQNALISHDLGFEFDPGPLTASFLSPQRAISFSASCFFSGANDGVLTAFDAAGAVVAQDGPRPVDCSTFTARFSVALAASTITRFEFQIGANFEIIDDLAFDGEPSPPPPPTPPVVSITSPTAGQVVDVVTGTVPLTGTVTGEGVVLARLTTTESPLPGLPPRTTTVGLTLVPGATPDTFTFATTLGSGLTLGPVTVTVEAVNFAGATGASTVTFVNAVPNISGACNPGTPLGDVRFGFGSASCIIAGCTTSGVTALGPGAPVIAVPPPIFEKVLAVIDRRLGSTGTLGCAIAAATEPSPGIVRQDFERGRVFETPGGVFYEPQVFASAIDGLGGDPATGFPTMDPPEAVISGSLPTLYFQRYRRPDGNGAQDATYEIRGEVTPTLTVERPGGGGGVDEFRLAGLTLGPQTATIWETFACRRDATVFTCFVGPQPPGDPSPDVNERFCSGGSFPIDTFNSWPAVIGDNENTSIVGWIRGRSPDVAGAPGSHMAGGDDPVTHENRGPPFLFPSDWNIHIIPLARFWSLLGANANHSLENEIEQYFINYFQVAIGFPQGGDLFFSSGRWIVDCGHTSGNTEIHPPSIFASMRTDTFFSRPVTRAEIYVGGFFNGRTTGFDLYPPPRPTPTATLAITHPPDTDTLGVTPDLDFLIDHIRPVFTAPLRSNPVTTFGEKKFLSGRGYFAAWTVGWVP
jgi:hypothetical protein